MQIRGDMGDGIKPEYYSQSGSTGYNRMLGYGDFSPWKNLTIKNVDGEILHTYDLTYMYVSPAGHEETLYVQLSNINPPYTSELSYGIDIKIYLPEATPNIITGGMFYSDSASPSGLSLIAKVTSYATNVLRYFNQNQGKWLPCIFVAQEGDSAPI